MKLRLYHHPDGARVAYREAGTGPPLALDMIHEEGLLQPLPVPAWLRLKTLRGPKPGSPGRPHLQTTLTEMDRTQQALFRLFDLDRYRKSPV